MLNPNWEMKRGLVEFYWFKRWLLQRDNSTYLLDDVTILPELLSFCISGYTGAIRSATSDNKFNWLVSLLLSVFFLISVVKIPKAKKLTNQAKNLELPSVFCYFLVKKLTSSKMEFERWMNSDRNNLEEKPACPQGLWSHHIRECTTIAENNRSEMTCRMILEFILIWGYRRECLAQRPLQLCTKLTSETDIKRGIR